MSHSTTTTTTHVLVKYSRSYPSIADQSLGPNMEWQHFVNPVMRLTLDVKKSLKGELESVRLRILWSINSGTDSMDVDQREVVFEDLDLLSFSTPASQIPHHKQASQGLPLKAVYRDSVVGIRYLHRSNTQPSLSTYRRFQITFQSVTAASQFIDAIRYVCPCKINPTPVSGRDVTFAPTGPNGSEGLPPQTPMIERVNSIAYTPAYAAPTLVPAVQTLQMFPLGPTSSPNIPVSSPYPQIDSPVVPHSTLHFDHSSRPSTSTSTAPFVPKSNPNAIQNFALLNGQIDGSQPGPERNLATIQTTSTSTSIPDPSPPSSNQSMMPPPSLIPQSQVIPDKSLTSVPDPQTSTLSQETCIESLRGTSALHNLSRVELEKLVAEVVREEGFAKLLERLDSMWQVKGFLGR